MTRTILTVWFVSRQDSTCLEKRLFRVSCEEVFTAEAQSSQRSEDFLTKNSLLRVLRASVVQSPGPASHRSLKNLKKTVCNRLYN